MKIAAGGFSSFALNSKGEIQGFGPDIFRLMTDIPKGFGYKDISTAFHYALAINSDNEIVGWGSSLTYPSLFDTYDVIKDSDYFEPNYQVANIPKGSNYVAISTGSQYSLALTSDGEIVCWGKNYSLNSSCKIPEGNNFVAISVGTGCAIALRSTGKIESWKYDGRIPIDLNFTAISTNKYNPLGLRKDGTIICWGDNKAPEGEYIAISAGGSHALALKSDNTLVSWGNNEKDQLTRTPKESNFVAIATGLNHSIALNSKNEITIWGRIKNYYDVNESFTLS